MVDVGSLTREQLLALGDWALLDAWLGGERRAAAVLVTRYADQLQRFFRNKVRRREDANDLVSETMLRCPRSGAKARRGTAFNVFLFSVAINVLREYVRKQYKRAREQSDFGDVCVGDVDERDSPSRLLAVKEQTRLLVRGLRRIPLKQQIVLELRVFEELPVAQIAELLGVPAATVYTRLDRGTKRLQEVIEELAESDELARSTIMGLETWAADVRAQALV